MRDVERSRRARDAAVVARAARDVAEATTATSQRSSNDALEREKRRECDDARDDASDDDDDARDAYVIPPSICRPLVYTSWFPLAPACAAMARAPRDARARGLAALSAALIASSFGHWRGAEVGQPRGGTSICASCGRRWGTGAGWRRRWSGRTRAGGGAGCRSRARRSRRTRRRFVESCARGGRDGATRAHRRFIYRRTTWTHLVGVHAGSSTAASWLAFGVARQSRLVLFVAHQVI